MKLLKFSDEYVTKAYIALQYGIAIRTYILYTYIHTTHIHILYTQYIAYMHKVFIHTYKPELILSNKY